jgi:hypothetical protein
MKIPVQKFGDELKDLFAARKMVVFLCGPAINCFQKPGEKLRALLEDVLAEEGFDVVLGEDDGLEKLRGKFNNYAHENELQFILRHCDAVILIASSVGSFCELGLFSYVKVREKGEMDFILIIDKEYQGKKSYLIEGPAAAIEDFGKVFYGDLDYFDISLVIDRLKRRRAVFLTKRPSSHA